MRKFSRPTHIGADRKESKKPFSTLSLKRVWQELVWPRRGLLGLGLTLIMVNRLAGLVLPGASKFLIDDVVAKEDLQLLVPLVSLVGIAVVLQAVSSFTLTQLLSKTAQRVIAELRIKVQAHIGRLPVRYYDANKAGALVSRIMSDVSGVRNLVGTGLVELIGGILTAVVAFGLLLRINSTLTLVSVGFLAIFGLVATRAFSFIRPIYRERGKIHAEVSGRLTESLNGVRVVKGFHAEARESEVFARGAWRLFENIKKTLTATSLLGMGGTLFTGVVSISVMVVGARMMVQGQMSLGDFVAYSLYLGLMIAPVMQVVRIGSQLTEAFAGLDRAYEVLEEVPEDVDPDRTVTIGRIEGRLVFQKVAFGYERDKPVLRGISLEAAPGTVTALVGSSGSGKSTLIGLVAAFAKPTEGTILVDGIDLSQVKLQSYRSQLGVVLQDNFLLDGTIRENIQFGWPDAGPEQVEAAARIARVDEFALNMTDKYETVIGERGVKLSGGQRQRVAIARAVLANPRILILDEATSSLDSESEALIQKGLSALMEGRTTFVIAHRLSTIRGATQILVMEDGLLVERGTHPQLMSRQGRYYDLYTRQLGVEANRFINPGEADPIPPPEDPAIEGKPFDPDQDPLGIIQSEVDAPE